MWPKKYKDYPVDSLLKKERAKTGGAIIGVEMNERNGWGEEDHRPRKKKQGLLARLFGSQKP